MTVFEYIKELLRLRLLRFLRLDRMADEMRILSEAVIEHDKMLAINAIVQVRIMSDLNSIAYDNIMQAKKTRIRKDDDDLEN